MLLTKSVQNQNTIGTVESNKNVHSGQNKCGACVRVF
jgi:hypothetical protein